MKKFKIGQIGIGHNHAQGHMEAFRLHPDLFEIVGYSENSEYWLKKRGGLACYDGIARLGEDELIDKCDALLVETEVPDLMAAARKCIDRIFTLTSLQARTLPNTKAFFATRRKRDLSCTSGTCTAPILP